MLFQTIGDLAKFINPGQKFIVENGQWTGHVKYKDTDGITIDMHDMNGNIVRHDIFFTYDKKCEWYIFRITEIIDGKEKWRNLARP